MTNRFIPKATHEVTVDLRNGQLVAVLDLSRPLEPLFWDQDFWAADLRLGGEGLPKYSFEVANITGKGIRIQDFETGTYVPIIDLERMKLLQDLRVGLGAEKL